jgi:hypothetical protein
MATITRELFEFLPALSDHDDNGASAQQNTSTKSLLQKALDAPVDHPTLAASIFPGDRVSILVQNGLPAARETLESLVSILEASRIETANIRVIVAQPMASIFELVESAAADPESKTPTTYRMQSDQQQPPLCFEIHDTEDEHASCYLAANEQGNPVYVNRSLCDSDVILPLSSLTPNKKLSDCLYPEFSTSETRARFRKKDDSVKQRIAEAELANDSLGLFFSIELICSPGGIIDDIVCGSRTQTRQIAAEMLKARWEVQSDDEHDVVVTTIESSSESATWSNVVRAVVAAAKLVEEGPIVVWSELNEKPNSKIKSACSAQFEGSVPDSLPKKLQHFASILCERPVFLKSKLSQNLIEGMGLGFVESAESVERIVRPFQNPLLIRDGHLRG